MVETSEAPTVDPADAIPVTVVKRALNCLPVVPAFTINPDNSMHGEVVGCVVTNAVLPSLILNDLAEAEFEHAIRIDQISLPFGPSDPPGTVNDGPATSLVDCVMRPAERFGSAVGDATNRGLPVPEYVSAKISPAVSLVITHQYQPPVVRPPAFAGRYA